MHIDPDITRDAQTVRDDYHGLIRHQVLELVPQGANNVLDIGGGIGARAA